MTMAFIRAAWAMIAANLAVNGTVDWTAIPRRAWSMIVAGLDRVRRSFVALVSSPAAWLAVGVVAFGGFWLGHSTGAHGKRALRDRAVTAERAAASAVDRAAMLASANREALVQIKSLKGQVEALEAEAARRSPAAKSGPVEAVSRRPVPKARKSKPPASAPAKAAWAPWNR